MVKGGKMKKIINLRTIIFILIILILSFRLIYLFGLRKSSHVDETYSVGIANSLGLPIFISPGTDEDGNEYYRNVQAWYDGQAIKDYFVVNEGERFDLAGVVQNKLWDTALPNYEILINFVFSFFPGTFSWGYLFAINFVFYVLSLVVIFFIGKNFFAEPVTGFINGCCCMLFWGLSVCGTGAYTYFRMYGVLSFYSLLMVLMIAKLIKKDGSKVLLYIGLSLSVFFGLATHTLFIVFAFWITFFSCLYLLMKKRIKDCFITGGVVLGTLIFLVVIYPFDPAIVSTWMNETNDTGFSFYTNLTYANIHTFAESLGFYLPVTVPNIVFVLGVLVFIAIIVFLLKALFRNESWFKDFEKKALTNLSNVRSFFRNGMEKVGPSFWLILFTAIAYMITTAAISPVVTQGMFATRYFFMCMNLVIICFVTFWLMIYDGFRKKTKIITGIVILALFSFLIYSQNYLFGNPFIFNKPYDDEDEFREMVADSDVMVFAVKPWYLYCLLSPLRDVDNFYFDCIYMDQLETCSATMPEGDFYVMVDPFYFEGSDVYHIDASGNSFTSLDYVNNLVENSGESYDVEYIRDFYSYPEVYSIYYLKKNM